MTGALLVLLLTATPSEIEQRVERVVNGLLPSAAFTGRFGTRAKLEERMAYFHTPGVSIAVINEGRIEWARAFGVREQGKPDPVTEATLFQAGSVSKPIFAMAVMRLVQEKTLDLDEDVNRGRDDGLQGQGHGRRRHGQLQRGAAAAPRDPARRGPGVRLARVLPAEKTKATVPDRVLESYAGDYATKSGVKLSVTRTEGGLRLAAEGQPPIDLTAESETKLHTPMLNTEFVFASAEKDRPASLTLSQGGRQTTAEKVALAPSEEKETN